MVRVIAVANQKGGVGKTTTTVNVAAALGQAGHRVLVVDLDPPGNASQALGISRVKTTPSVYEVLLGGLGVDEAMLPTNSTGVWCVPASVDLAGAEVELVAHDGRELRLAGALGEFIESGALDADRGGCPVEFVIIDCPPSLGLLTVNALVAAHELFVPIQAEFYALDGVGQLIKTMELVRSALNKDLHISLVVMTMVGPETRSQQYVTDEVRAFFGSRVAAAMIPRDTAASAAPSVGQTVLSYAPDSAVAGAYATLADNLLTAVHEQEEMSKI